MLKSISFVAVTSKYEIFYIKIDLDKHEQLDTELEINNKDNNISD
ncbi:hypothetical protein [Paraclostridium sordellii]|nr:hypothetical protein [Paeniclostridium sordellii]